MRILMVSDFYPPFVGGVEVVVSTLARQLAVRGHTVAVATLAADGLAAEETDAGVTVHRLSATTQRVPGLFANAHRPWAPPTPDPGVTAGLRSCLHRETFDVVHGHDWLARSFVPLKRRHGPAFVQSLHYFTHTCPKKNLMRGGVPCSGPAFGKCLRCAGEHYGTLKGTAVTVGNRVFARADAAVVDLFLPVSEATAEGNRLRSSGLRYEVVPNLIGPAIPSGDVAGFLRELPTEPFLLFVGDIRRDKGVDVLLHAYGDLAEPPPLVLIGKLWPDTPSELPPGVRLLADWPNVAVRAAMERCLALVVPSVWPEPFGMVVAEAMSAGRPVVASNIGGIPEIVGHEREGLLVPAADGAALSSALHRVVENPAEREAMAARARERAVLYQPESIVPRFEAAYERVVATRQQRSI